MRPGENRFADFEDQQGRNIGRSDAFAGDFLKSGRLPAMNIGSEAFPNFSKRRID